MTGRLALRIAVVFLLAAVAPRRLLLTLAAALAAASPLGAAPDFAAVEDQSNIHFSVPLMAVSKVSGKFMDYEVWLDAGDKPDLSHASAKAFIHVASVDTGNDSWDAKLRKPEWFDTGKFPKIRFESTKVRRVGDRWEADGHLTLHGVTKEITLPFTFEGRFEGPNPDEHVGIHATFKFDRRDYGMDWAGNAEAKAVGNMVTVEITILAEQVKPKGKTAASPPPSKRGTPGRTSTARSPARP
jgi:polyisoprenoid-binding protein YceI